MSQPQQNQLESPVNNSNNSIINITISDHQSSNSGAAPDANHHSQQPSNTAVNPEDSHQIIASFRSTMERSLHERTFTSNWRSNLSQVFQDIRPLVQHAQNANNSHPFSWMQANGLIPAMPGTTSSNTNREPSMGHINNNNTQSTDSFVINLDMPSHQGFNTPQRIQNHERLTTPPSSSSSSSSQPLLPTINPLSQSQRNDSNNTHLQPHHHLHHHHHQQQQYQHNVAGNDAAEVPAEAGNDAQADAFTQLPEARAVFQAMMRYVPFICILLAKGSYDHLDGILDFFALFITFSHANRVVRQEIGRHAQRSVWKLLREMMYIILVIVVIGFMLEKNNIFISIIFVYSYPDPFTLRHLLFSVGVTDLILKLITVGIKIVITLMPPSVLEYKERGRVFLMTEAISQLWRGIAPIQPWLMYLLDAYTGYEKLLGVVFSAAYVVAKGSDLVQTVLLIRRAFTELWKKVSFGIKPSKEQLQTAGGQCPICHDSYTSPVLLVCSHIFCELCVGTWFDREQTCPLCRAKVADDPSWRDGATALFIQLF